MMEERNYLPELPKGWVRTTVDEVGELLRGVSYKKHEASKEPRQEYVPVLRANNINSGLNFDDLVYVPRQRVKDEQLLRAGDIVICMSSGSKHLVGKASQATKEFYGGFGAFCGLVRVSEELDERYVGFFFQSPLYRNATSRLSSGVNINNLRRDHIESMPLPLAPLPEQQRIVAKIEELFTQLDAGVAALEKAKAQLRRYRQAVLKAAVEGELTREWREAHRGELEPASVLLKRILEERRAKWEAEHPGKEYKPPVPPDTESLPELPERWVWTTFGQVICLSQNGTGTRRSQEGEPTIVLRLADIVNGETISLEDVRRIKLKDDEVEKYRLFENDLLCIRVNGSPNLVGRIIPFETSSEPIVFCDHFIRFRLAVPEITPFLSMCFDMDRVRRYVDINKVSSAGQNTVSQGTMAAIAVPLPSLTEQQHIMYEVEQRLSVIDEMEKAVEQSLKRAKRLRQSILKRAFEGKLVPQDPSDEPASVLLERIREKIP